MALKQSVFRLEKELAFEKEVNPRARPSMRATHTSHVPAPIPSPTLLTEPSQAKKRLVLSTEHDKSVLKQDADRMRAEVHMPHTYSQLMLPLTSAGR